MSYDQVEEFHLAFSLPVETEPVKELYYNALMLRFNLMKEELLEVKEAMEDGDMTKILHELADLQYVLDGTVVSLGLQSLMKPAIDRIHEANMNKIWPDGFARYNEHGKVIKPPGFEPADLSDLIKE